MDSNQDPPNLANFNISTPVPLKGNDLSSSKMVEFETVKGNNIKNGYDIEIINNEYKEYDYSFKIIVVGNTMVGKSCLSLKGTKDIYEEGGGATIGLEFFNFCIRINKTILKLQVWDTCGQEAYRSLIANFYRNSSVGILVYAINDKKSFEDLDSWLKQLKTHASPDCKIILIGNKADLENEREITFQEGQKFAKENKFEFFLETSAKTGLNAKKVFADVALSLYKEFLDINNGVSNKLISERKALEKMKKTFELKLKEEEEQESEIGCC